MVPTKDWEVFLLNKLESIQGRTRLRSVLLIVGIVLLAANLRASITAVGPLVGMLRAQTGLSSVLVGLLSTLPLLAFAVFSPLAPLLGARWGLERVLLGSLILLTVGILLRSLPVLGLLFVGTTILGAAIALGNVLLAGLIKQVFPQLVGPMTALYSTVMGVGGALAAGISIPLAQQVGLGWRGSLICWAIPAAVAAGFWLCIQRSHDEPATTRAATISGQQLWRSPLAWQVTLFMGLQSLNFYIAITWFPAIFQSKGMEATSAGWMISLMQVFGVVGSFLTPLFAGRLRSQRLPIAIAIVLGLISYVGLLTSPTALIPLWCILLGLAQGAYLSLALLFFILRTRDNLTATQLSGMAQSIGYLLAAFGPLLFGALHDLTHSWTLPLVVLIFTTLVLFSVGMGVGRDVTVNVS